MNDQGGGEARALFDLPGGVVGAEDALHGQQREPVLGDRGPQLIEADTVGLEPLEQIEASLPLLALEAVQQPGRFEVHAEIFP
ncbi:MAG: hypothetical protein M3065_07265 [Actinomycetota bacterium]|nr:hypothetical protein [Actinomycetota bacterium]